MHILKRIVDLKEAKHTRFTISSGSIRVPLQGRCIFWICMFLSSVTIQLTRSAIPLRWHRRDRRLVCGRAIECSVHKLKFAARPKCARAIIYGKYRIIHTYLPCVRGQSWFMTQSDYLSAERIRRIKKFFITLAGRIRSLSADLCTKYRPDSYFTLLQSQVLAVKIQVYP